MPIEDGAGLTDAGMEITLNGEIAAQPVEHHIGVANFSVEGNPGQPDVNAIRDDSVLQALRMLLREYDFEDLLSLMYEAAGEPPPNALETTNPPIGDRPEENRIKAKWVDHAIALGLDADLAHRMTKKELIEWIG